MEIIPRGITRERIGTFGLFPVVTREHKSIINASRVSSLYTAVQMFGPPPWKT